MGTKEIRDDKQKMSIHPTAIIHQKAELDSGVEVGPYSVIGEDVKIAKGTNVGPHVVIEGHASIGENCSIYQFASIGTPPQDIRFAGEKTEVVIGKDCTIREFVTVNRGTSHGSGRTLLKDRIFLMAYAHVAHDCIIGNDVIMSNAATLAGHIEIEDFAIIGGLVAVHQFVKIGAYSMIGGASAVSHDVPPYVTAVGNRATLYGLNSIGLKRHGFSAEDIGLLKKAYRIIFRSELPLKKAIDKVKGEVGSSQYIDHLLEFIKGSTRGICR
ncbi:MAG: acyl-ACP--UDP-N-acetylglucosamine O-acyltransferase [Thermodesulfobacteriota bacterium]